MLRFITLLLVLQLLGESVVVGTGLPVPGPVVGMALLFALLALLGRVPEELEATAQGLLRHLSLLFVPAGVGVVLHLVLMRDEWLPIGAALLLGTLATVAATAWLMVLFERMAGRRPTSSSGSGPTSPRRRSSA